MKVSENHTLRGGGSRLRIQMRSRLSGMTLLEMTVVILVLLGLITILFIGAQAWKRGSDRAICIVNIRNVQQGVRAYSNLYDFETNSSSPGLQGQIIGFGRFVERTPSCPGNGNYSFGGDTIPPIGTLYMDCSLAGSLDHEPVDFTDW